MTKRETTSLVLKLMSVYIVIRYIGNLSISFIPLALGYLEDTTHMFPFLTMVLAALLYLVCCILLIIYSNRVAGWIIHEDNSVRLPESISKDDIMTMAFCCIGLLVMTDAIRLLISVIPQYFLILGRMSEYFDGYKFWPRTTRLVGPFLQFILGLMLFIRAKGLVKLWHKIRV